ncbi:hypothetical protein ACFSL6_03375 [Paenibacillus thailandensis]|uniref:Uncharacterized protein n=1 Tax=Paenibacillus thailandensis TaxID=393250 RepID=A0ABW5R515_9BACL
MKEWNEKELLDFVAKETGLHEKDVALVLKHEQSYIDKAEVNAEGEAEIDGDELVDYIMSRPDVQLNELEIESVLDTEMDYLADKGLAGPVG